MLNDILKALLDRSSGPEKSIQKLANKYDSISITQGFEPNTFDYTGVSDGVETHGKIKPTKGKWEIVKIDSD